MLFQFILLVTTGLQAGLAYPNIPLDSLSKKNDYDSTLEAIQYGLSAERDLEDQLEAGEQDVPNYHQQVVMQNLQGDERLTNFIDNEEYSALQSSNFHEHQDEYFSADTNEIGYKLPDYNDEQDLNEETIINAINDQALDTVITITEGPQEGTEAPTVTETPVVSVAPVTGNPTVASLETEPTSKPASTSETKPIPGITPTLPTATEPPGIKKIIKFCQLGQRSTPSAPCKRFRLPPCRRGQKSTMKSPCKPRLKLCKFGQRSTPIKPCIPRRIRQHGRMKWCQCGQRSTKRRPCRHSHRVCRHRARRLPRIRCCSPGQRSTTRRTCLRCRRWHHVPRMHYHKVKRLRSPPYKRRRVLVPKNHSQKMLMRRLHKILQRNRKSRQYRPITKKSHRQHRRSMQGWLRNPQHSQKSRRYRPVPKNHKQKRRPMRRRVRNPQHNRRKLRKPMQKWRRMQKRHKGGLRKVEQWLKKRSRNEGKIRRSSQREFRVAARRSRTSRIG